MVDGFAVLLFEFVHHFIKFFDGGFDGLKPSPRILTGIGDRRIRLALKFLFVVARYVPHLLRLLPHAMSAGTAVSAEWEPDIAMRASFPEETTDYRGFGRWWNGRETPRFCTSIRSDPVPCAVMPVVRPEAEMCAPCGSEFF